MTWAHLADWLTQYTASGIEVARIEISRSEAEAARADAYSRWMDALDKLPYLANYYEREQVEFWDALLDGKHVRDLTATVFGFSLVLGPDDMDVGFRIIPKRDPMVFGASA